MDGTDVNRNVVTDLHEPCGIAVDSLNYVPPPVPAPLARSQLSLGKVKHNKRRHIAYLALNVPGEGHLDVGGMRGFSWRVLPEKTRGPNFTGGWKWLEIRADGKTPAGRRLKRLVRQKGRAEVLLSLQFTQVGKGPSLEMKKWVRLLGSRASRPRGVPALRTRGWFGADQEKP